MKKHVRILLAGVMVVVPFALTVYIIAWAGSLLDGLVQRLVEPNATPGQRWLFPGAGIVVAVLALYLVGLLTHLWVFRWAVGLLERMFSRVPVVKSIYESLRDVLKLFGGEAENMGQVVLYRLPGTEVKLLGIRTSTSPRGAQGQNRVAVYLPMSYQLGGFTVYVPPESVEPLDMSVEEAMKIAATADVGSKAESDSQPEGTDTLPPELAGGQ